MHETKVHKTDEQWEKSVTRMHSIRMKTKTTGMDQYNEDSGIQFEVLSKNASKIKINKIGK